jgi:hypothetical protein
MLRILVMFGALAFAGCKRQPSGVSEPLGSGAAPAPAPSGAPPAPAPAAGEISGTVVETMDASEYTYARLEHDGSSVWVAGPQTALALGTKIGPLAGTAMPGFHSEKLNRTFEQIYFITSFGTVGAATPTPPVAAAPATAGGEISGVVTETMNAGGYTYAQLDRAGTKLWVAGPETKLEVGSTLGAMTGTMMPKFHSDTLKRTFDEIYFINTFVVAAPAIPNPHSATAAATPAAPAVPIEKVAPATGGKTVADVFAGKDALAGKPVVVRGKIIKVTSGVLGRNWLHLQDGTGAAGTNDLLVTSQATAKVGDIVVVRGTVATKQDFGAGYRYDVLVENSTIDTGTASP